MKEDDYNIDLHKYSRFKRQFPWLLIVKTIIAFILVMLIYFGSQWITSTSKPINNKDEGIEVEVEL